MLIEDYKERLAYCCDPETFIDILEITMEELMDVFEEKLENNFSDFDGLFNITGGYDGLDE